MAALSLAGVFAGMSPAMAQRRAVPRIGFLFYGSPENSRELAAFREGLKEHGYVDGQNVIVEYRYARGKVDALPALARELVALDVDVIVTPTTPASIAAQRATSTIPVVFAGVADAVGAGLVLNLARPDGNITGFTSISSELGSKRLQILKETVRGAPRLGVLFNPEDRANTLVLKELQIAESSVGVSLRGYGARTLDELNDMIAAMARDGVAGFFGAAGVLTFEHRQAVVDLAARHRLPALWGHRQFVDAGGLMSYAVNFYDQVKRSVGYVDRILKGSKAGDLPVQQPTKFELVINVTAARQLGLSLPQTLMFAADEVQE